MDPQEVRPGDLLLVTRIPGDPLGELMEELDGTCFSHSGIALGDGKIASALAGNTSVGTDVGGIRRDDFSDFWPHRDLYCIPMGQEHRDRATRYLAQFPEEPGREGRFGFTKLVTVAAALYAIEVGASDRSESLHRAAEAIARAWAATTDFPAFYCAELVATAYDVAFTRTEMTPPPVVRGGGGVLEMPAAVLAWLSQLLDEQFLSLTEEQKRTRGAMIELLWNEHPDFVQRALEAVTGSALAALRGPVGEVRVPEPLRDGLPVPDDDPVVPAALVTPRMLWARFGRGTLCRVEQPRVT